MKKKTDENISLKGIVYYILENPKHLEIRKNINCLELDREQRRKRNLLPATLGSLKIFHWFKYKYQFCATISK